MLWGVQFSRRDLRRCAALGSVVFQCDDQSPNFRQIQLILNKKILYIKELMICKTLSSLAKLKIGEIEVYRPQRHLHKSYEKNVKDINPGIFLCRSYSLAFMNKIILGSILKS